MRNLILFFFCLTFCALSAQVEEGELLSQWNKDGLVGSSRYDNTYNEVWGYAKDGKEYAIMGSTAGTHIIEVTDPTTPEEIHFIPGASRGAHIIHRDYHDYKGYLYAVADEDTNLMPSTLQIMDLSYLPDSLPVVYSGRDKIQTVHNIFIDTTSAKLYALSAKGGSTTYSAMRIYDLADPLNPEFLSSHRTFGDWTIGHVHDAFVDDDIAYLNCGGDGFALVDFSDPMNPILMSSLRAVDNPDFGYNHSGWPTADENYYYMGDETWGREMKVVEVTDKSAATAVGTFDAGSSSSFSIAHNQIVACDYLYVSHYYDGLQVYDISDQTNPIRVMEYLTSSKSHRNNYEGAWGVYPFLPSGNILVSDMQEGLFVIKGIDNGCNLLSSAEEPKVNGLEFNVFPNPVNDYLHIELPEKLISQELKIILLDIDGRVLQQVNVRPRSTRVEIKLNSNQVNTGMKILKIESGEKVLTKKLFHQ